MHVVVNILHLYPRKFYVCFASNLLAYIIIPQNKGKEKISWDKKLTTTCIKNHDSLTAIRVSLRCCVKFPQVQYINFSEIGQFFWKLSPFWLTCTGEHFNLSVMLLSARVSPEWKSHVLSPRKSVPFPWNRVRVPSIEETNTKILLTFFQGQNLCPLNGGTVPWIV